MKNYKNLIFLLSFILFIFCSNQEEEKEKVGKYISEGMTAYSEENYTKAVDLFKKAFTLEPDNSAVVYNIACFYALIGETDSAMVWLEKSFELGTYKFSDDEDLASLKEDKRFQKLEKKAEERIKELELKEWKPVVLLPEEFKKEKKYPAVIALHGFGSNPINFSNALDPGITPLGYILCCPYGPEIRGTTSFGWGDYEISEKRILETLEFLKETYKIDATRTILLGYSRGGARAFYTVLKNPEFFSSIISVAGHYDENFDGFLEQNEVKGIKVYIMIGEKDYLLESNKRAEKLMKKKGIPVKLVIYPELGHAFPQNSKEELKKALQWIERGK